MTRHLVIFAKAPGLGRAKRRLAGDIGAVEAARFYRQTLARTIATCARDRRWKTWLWIDPDARSSDPVWRAAGRRLPARAQGRGDLGQRMARPFRRLPPGPVVLIGSDIPAITRAAIAQAFRRLGACDLVFGPSVDGGYWLIGAKRMRPWQRGIFDGVRWSTRHALADTRTNVTAQTLVGFAATLEDIDGGEAYRRWKAGTG